ncbi:MAG: RNA 2',3'-cyclic phosphodiesterase [Candidatus Woesearchaeota archaeon]
MRLFIAFDVNNNMKKYLFEIQNKLNVNNDILKISSGFHLTLKYLGEQSKSKTELIIKELSSIKFQKFNVHTKGIGFFKKNNQIKIVWCGIEPKDEILNLKKLIDEKLKKIGFVNFDKKEFFPHITLIRVKKINDVSLFKENIKNLKKKEIESVVDSFTLYKSTLTEHGPIYNVIERFKLV